MLLLMNSLILTVVFMLPVPEFSRAGCEFDVAREIPNTEVNIEDFGAIADDNIDDAAAINAAISSLGSKGGTVRIPSGRWVVEEVTRHLWPTRKPRSRQTHLARRQDSQWQ